jgi:hypothetical protein
MSETVDKMTVCLIDKKSKVQITNEETMAGIGIYDKDDHGLWCCTSILISDLDAAKTLLGAVFQVVKNMEAATRHQHKTTGGTND